MRVNAQAVGDNKIWMKLAVGDSKIWMEMVLSHGVDPKAVGDSKIWMKMGADVSIVECNGKILDIEIPPTMILEVAQTILDIEIPPTMILEVAQTDPGAKGNTAQGATKMAVLETGAE
ncbi:hypothetical protein T484DRAFT_1790748, partial [Baffinella frigidus]